MDIKYEYNKHQLLLKSEYDDNILRVKQQDNQSYAYYNKLYSSVNASLRILPTTLTNIIAGYSLAYCYICIRIGVILDKNNYCKSCRLIFITNNQNIYYLANCNMIINDLIRNIPIIPLRYTHLIRCHVCNNTSADFIYTNINQIICTHEACYQPPSFLANKICILYNELKEEYDNITDTLYNKPKLYVLL